MYKVLLVDDEALIREAISEKIRWQELGFELSGTCENGKEAIERIKRESPDLLITDICMPYIDGMELTKYVYEHNPGTKVIIISGYDEFEYAKKAVKYQVLEYVLKPVTALELTELLTKIKTEFDKEADRNKNLKRIREAYISNLPVMKGRFLNSLIQNEVKEEDIKKKEEEFGIDLACRYFITAIVESSIIGEYKEKHPGIKEELILFSIFNIAEEIVNNYQCGIAFQNGDGKTLIIFKADKEKGFSEKAAEISREIQQALNHFMDLEVSAGIGKAVPGKGWLSRSYETARAVLEYQFLFGHNVILDARILDQKTAAEPIDIGIRTERIVLDVKTGDKAGIKKTIGRLTEEIKNRYTPKSRVIIYIQNIVLSVVNLLDSAGLSDEAFIDGEYDFINSIYMRRELSEIEADLLVFCEKVSELMADEKDSTPNRQAIMALDYIDKNYGNSEISLNSVCTYLAISTSYFSSIFKNYTGITFIEALTKKRIEKAKSLIENTSLKSYEIADEVGFGDPHYFSITFKKHTGFTPTEYAKNKRKA